eukprot:TRINITY_DN4935_c0_g7_i1.p1 TRINITY_DN4935_c0_g7~~TRINITY_DN4935_c0_g7_i1.p1  ORF type:complete len:524 (-),score=27.07 TRINITY_DN4935_c0_g7_i1:75-1646(-)
MANVIGDDSSKKAAPKRLCSSLPASLLRGVPTDIALQGYGRHWQSNAGCPEDFLLSAETQIIDDFISHDWRTPRLVKYVALSYVYNGQAAVVISTVLAVVVALARETWLHTGQTEPVRSRGLQLADLFSCVIIGPLVFFGVLFHWQKTLAMLGRRKLSFVDKLCIAQHDEAMKRQCILGLSAFLKHSRRLVVLWSPTYFSRLWCTYELATWFRYQRLLSSVLFVPVEIPVALVAVFLLMVPQAIGTYIAILLDVAVGTIHLSTLFTGCVLACYVVLGHVEHVIGLRHDLDTFQVERTACFCCSNNHRHPETELPLLCDREMVHDTMREWLNSSGRELQSDEHLSIFNNEVRTTLKHYVTGALPVRRLFITYAQVLTMGLPIVYRTVDQLILHYKIDYTYAWMYFLSDVSTWLLAFPIQANLLLRAMHAVHGRQAGIRRTRTRKIVLACCLWGPFEFVMVALLRYSVDIDVYIQINMFWPFFVVIALQSSLVYFLFAQRSEKGVHRPAATWALAVKILPSMERA